MATKQKDRPKQNQELHQELQAILDSGNAQVSKVGDKYVVRDLGMPAEAPEASEPPGDE